MTSDFAVRDASALPWLRVDQMREVDRAMVEDYGIGLVQMMELAGRNLAHLARGRFLRGDARGADIAVLVGSGGNGGGALVAARRLASWGAHVHVLLGAPSRDFGEVPRHQLDIARRLALPIHDAVDSVPEGSDLILDGLIGYSLQGSPRGDSATRIRWANASGVPILALDVPSGLHADTGAVGDPTIRAAATMTLALPKRGLRAPEAAGHVGELYLADIGVPPALYVRPPLALPAPDVFSTSDLVRIG